MRISIITATFNSSRTIQNTFDSLLNQTYKDVELIVKDGGSNDNTLEICRRYQQAFYGRMHILCGPDNGIYDAMNQGVRAATGDIVGILNSDDFYTDENVLETVVNAFEKTDCDAVYGDVHYVQEGDLTRCIRYYSSANFTRDRMLYGWMLAHPSFYCRRDVYRKYGLFDESFKVAADFEHLLRLIYINKIKIQYINKDFVTMRMGGASTSGIKSHIIVMKEQLKAFKKNNINNNVFRLSLRYFKKILEYCDGK